MVNPKLEKAIKAAGGVTKVGALVDKTEAAIYLWRRAGRVYDGQDAVKLLARAKECGCTDVTIEDLVGMTLPRLDGGPRRVRRSRPSSRCSPTLTGIGVRLSTRISPVPAATLAA